MLTVICSFVNNTTGKLALKKGFIFYCSYLFVVLIDSSSNVMAHDEERERKWRGNWRMECLASTLHTTSEHGVSSITNSDAHTSALSSRLKWRPRWFKWTRKFRRKTKSGFCACAITFQMQSTAEKIPRWIKKTINFNNDGILIYWMWKEVIN